MSAVPKKQDKSHFLAADIKAAAENDLIHAGVDSMTVAQLAGTSVAMIEKHYGHLTRDHARAALAALAL